MTTSRFSKPTLFQIANVLLIAATSAWANPGDRQSPINIQTNAAATLHLAAIVPTYADNVTLSLFHTYDPNRVPALGREWATLRANVPAGSFVTVGQTRYNLLQFHFHTPSEHQVNAKSAPMEIHFVHLREGASPCDPDALLVVGARIIEGGTHRELNKIFGLPALPTNNTTPAISIANFNLTAVVPGLQHSWRYVGSLTAPTSFGTCNEPEGTVEEQLSTGVFPENVQWVVATKDVTMSKSQIEKFRALFDEEGNARPVQPKGQRVIGHAVHPGCHE